MIEISPAFRPLLDRPILTALATVRPDDTAQVNPMWFDFDGEHLLFTHTTRRGKFRNLESNPSMSAMFIDPDDQYRYLELRGHLVESRPDPTGAFYVHLGQRYGDADTPAPPDSADRVVLVMGIDRAVTWPPERRGS